MYNGVIPSVTIGGSAWGTIGANGLTAFTRFATHAGVTSRT